MSSTACHVLSPFQPERILLQTFNTSNKIPRKIGNTVSPQKSYLFKFMPFGPFICRAKISLDYAFKTLWFFASLIRKIQSSQYNTIVCAWYSLFWHTLYWKQSDFETSATHMQLIFLYESGIISFLMYLYATGRRISLIQILCMRIVKWKYKCQCTSEICFLIFC